ncbi:MAG: hypothetical protein MZV70_37540 [Desulfobacterales bacterium]|nr:hypothetical protein [Desulfobacterales bacterium]
MISSGRTRPAAWAFPIAKRRVSASAGAALRHPGAGPAGVDARWPLAALGGHVLHLPAFSGTLTG